MTKQKVMTQSECCKRFNKRMNKLIKIVPFNIDLYNKILLQFLNDFNKIKQ